MQNKKQSKFGYVFRVVPLAILCATLLYVSPVFADSHSTESTESTEYIGEVIKPFNIHDDEKTD